MVATITNISVHLRRKDKNQHPAPAAVNTTVPPLTKLKHHLQQQFQGSDRQKIDNIQLDSAGHVTMRVTYPDGHEFWNNTGQTPEQLIHAYGL